MRFPEALANALEDAPYWMPVSGVIEDRMDGVERLESEAVAHERWSVVYRNVYRYEGQYWAVEYDEPATENQEIDNSEYSVYEVTPVTKTIIDYVRATS